MTTPHERAELNELDGVLRGLRARLRGGEELTEAERWFLRFGDAKGLPEFKDSQTRTDD